MRANKYMIMLLAFIFFSQETPAYAEADQTSQISAEITPHIKRAQQLLDANSYEAALSSLDETLQSTNIAPHEKSLLFQMKGQAHYELYEYHETIQAFEDSIRSNGLTDDERHQLRLYIAQIYIAEGDYQRGAEMLEQWGRAGNALKPVHTDLIMQAYIQIENYEAALPWAERWFHDARPKERKHYGLMNFLYFNLGQSEKQIEIVKAMRTRWPDEKVLSDSLASMYANNGQEREAFDVTRDYYLTGNPHRESDILILVKYYSHYEMPYEAAQILEKEIEAGRVSKSLKNTVWLSILHQEAGFNRSSNMFFAEAIEMSGKIAAIEMRETLMAPQQTHISDNFGILSRYPDFKPPKIGGMYRIIVSDRDAQPLVRIPPVTPKIATKSAHCKVRFNVDSVGKPENIVATFCTEDIFKMPSIESIGQWKYKPKIVDGRQIARHGVETTVRFLVRDTKGSFVPE